MDVTERSSGGARVGSTAGESATSGGVLAGGAGSLGEESGSATLLPPSLADPAVRERAAAMLAELDGLATSIADALAVDVPGLVPVVWRSDASERYDRRVRLLEGGLRQAHALCTATTDALAAALSAVPAASGWPAPGVPTTGAHGG